ncbi:MAG: hypothetical protein E6H09_18770 [Bacteroidetes bacterium]|nr:MAG: hypothetical protein E6H09_18770 [Bacteroidota bacterium]
MTRFATIADLTDPNCLSQIVGPITAVQVTPFTAIGFSGSVLHRVQAAMANGSTKNFVFKRTELKADWLSQRTNDRIGREAALLGEKDLEATWTKIVNPYVAYAREKDSSGLLMDDLSEYLFPDLREPIELATENIIIDTVASLHALFWDSPVIKKISWLNTPVGYLDLLTPGTHEQDEYCPSPDKIRTNISDGWKLALELVSPQVRKYLCRPVNEIFQRWENLPVTLLHGDLKIANMAIVPGDRLALFDWPLVGCAPCSIELGWYIAVNATRLAGTKEDFLTKYRNSLQSQLKQAIDEKTWQQMIKLAVVSGSLMMLWSKALGRSRSNGEEWEWWNSRLEEVVNA